MHSILKFDIGCFVGILDVWWMCQKVCYSPTKVYSNYVPSSRCALPHSDREEIWVVYNELHIAAPQALDIILFLSGIYNPCEFKPPHSWGYVITHKDTPHSVGILWTSDQPVAETSTWQHTQHLEQSNVHVPGGIRTRNPLFLIWELIFFVRCGISHCQIFDNSFTW
jgi:hypothetical protein